MNDDVCPFCDRRIPDRSTKIRAWIIALIGLAFTVFIEVTWNGYWGLRLYLLALIWLLVGGAYRRMMEAGTLHHPYPGDGHEPLHR